MPVPAESEPGAPPDRSLADAAREAAEARDRLELALEHSHTILFTLDLDLRIRWVSDVVGMPREAVLGRRMSEVIGEAEGTPLEDIARAVLAAGEPHDFEPDVTWVGVPRVYAARMSPILRDGTAVELSVAITDITELRAAERRQAEVRSALTMALGATGTIAYGQDREGRFEWTVGLPTAWEERFVGRTPADVFPGTFERLEAAARHQILDGAPRAEFEATLDLGTGTLNTIRVTLAPRLRDGEVAGILGTSTDVTALRLAERQARFQADQLEALVQVRTAALAASEERFRASLDATLDTLAICSPVRDEDDEIVDFRIDYANPSWREVYGNGVGEVVGLQLNRDFPYFRPRFARHVTAVVTGTPLRDIIVVPGDGEVRRFEYLLTPFRDGFIVSSRDVTERVDAESRLRRSEQRLRDLLEGVDAIVWEEDVRTGVIWVSRQAEPMLGYPVEQWSMDPDLWRRIIVPEDRDRIVAILDGPVSAEVEYSATRADGTVRRLRDRMTVVTSDSGEMTRRFGLTMDVTSLRELEVKAFSAERLDALGRFAGQIAHDVDNILWGVELFAQYARKTAQKGGDPIPDLDRVIDGLQHGSSLTRSLLDFARSRPGTPVPLDLAEVVHGFSPIVERLAGPAVALTIEVCEDPVVIVADRAAMEQVILNLCTNALQAMDEGGRLDVSVAVRSFSGASAEKAGVAKGKYAELVVHDNGKGMPPEVLARLGEPFFTTREGGTGLGLPGVYGIVKTFNGVVNVESRPGEGARFQVLLPISRLEVTARHEVSRRHGGAAEIGVERS